MKRPSGRTLRLNPIVLALLAVSAPVLAQTAAGTTAERPAVTLEQVEVRGEYNREDLPASAPGGQAATGARLGILGATRIIDAPVHVNAYTRALFEDYQALTLSDVLENDPAVRFTTNKGHLLQNFNLRGQDIATNGLYGIAPANQVPIELFERVEVMRGPNVLLSGMPPLASVAGSINMVTKRADSKPQADLTFTYGSKSYSQIHADVGRRFGPEQRLGLRVNGVYGKGEMGAKGEKQERKVGAIGLDYHADRARFMLDAYSSVSEIDNGSPGMFNFLGNAAIPGVGRLLAPPKGDVNMFRNTHGQYDNSGVLARAEVDLNSQWMGYLAVGGSDAEGKGLLFGTRAYVTGADGTTRGAIYNVHTKSERTTAEAGVIGKFTTGDVKHRLQVSLNTLRHKEGTNNVACNYCYTTNMYDPVTPVFPPAPVWNGYERAAARTNNDFRSLAVADTMAFAQDTVLLTVGMRHQTVKQPWAGYDASRVSPTIAGVVRPWGDAVSFFGNYTEGLQPGQTVGSTYANAGQTYKPMQTQQAELGVKLQSGALTHTVSTYQIERPSLIEQNNTLLEGGKQRLRGLEWSVYGKLTPTLSLLGGVTHIKSRQVDRARDTFGVPEWRAQMGLDWATPIDNLSVGGRVLYTGKQWADSSNRLRVPAWSRLDLTAGYAMKLGATPVKLNASIENVTDKQYWIGMFGDGFVMAGAPRTFRVSATVSF